jgi:hypothetical protein
MKNSTSRVFPAGFVFWAPSFAVVQGREALVKAPAGAREELDCSTCHITDAKSGGFKVFLPPILRNGKLLNRNDDQL